MEKDQVFIHHKIYPKAADIFNMELLPIEDIKDDCIYVIDTNALLIPYTTSSAGFDEIKKAYTTLIGKNQLIIPAQVAREFAKNRPEKIKTLFQQLSRIRDKIQKPSTGRYPLLEKLDEFKEAVEFEQEVVESQKKYSKKIGEILDKIKTWTWNDPISEVYNKLFDPNVIYDVEIDEDETIKELILRNKHSIPPGFKDKSKDDGGIGDLLIWLSIIDIAKSKGKDVVFVSGDEKNDWYHRSEGQPLYPRFELVAEFKDKTNNKSFHIIKLSRLLSLFGAAEEVVKEVERKEISSNISTYSDYRVFGMKCENAVLSWIEEVESGKEISTQEIGFPDIIIKDDKRMIGVEVLPVRERPDRPRMSLHPRNFQDRFLRAYYQLNEGDFDEFRLVVVGQTRFIMETEVRRSVERLSEKNKSEKIEIILGIINDEGKFEQI